GRVFDAVAVLGRLFFVVRAVDAQFLVPQEFYAGIAICVLEVIQPEIEAVVDDADHDPRTLPLAVRTVPGEAIPAPDPVDGLIQQRGAAMNGIDLQHPRQARQGFQLVQRDQRRAVAVYDMDELVDALMTPDLVDRGGIVDLDEHGRAPIRRGVRTGTGRA